MSDFEVNLLKNIFRMEDAFEATPTGPTGLKYELPDQENLKNILITAIANNMQASNEISSIQKNEMTPIVNNFIDEQYELYNNPTDRLGPGGSYEANIYGPIEDEIRENIYWANYEPPPPPNWDEVSSFYRERLTSGKTTKGGQSLNYRDADDNLWVATTNEGGDEWIDFKIVELGPKLQKEYEDMGSPSYTPSSAEQWLIDANNAVDLSLSGAGLTPGWGIVPDAINTVQNFGTGLVSSIMGWDEAAEQSWKNTGWAAGAMIPLGGQFITGGKYTVKAVDAATSIDKALKVGDASKDFSKLSTKALKGTDTYKNLSKIDADQLLLMHKDVKNQAKMFKNLKKENPAMYEVITGMLKNQNKLDDIADISKTKNLWNTTDFYKKPYNKYVSEPLKKNFPSLYNQSGKTTKFGDAMRFISPLRRHNYTGLSKWDYLLGGLIGHHTTDALTGNMGSFNWDDPRTTDIREGFGDAPFANLISNTIGAPFKFYGDLAFDTGRHDRFTMPWMEGFDQSGFMHKPGTYVAPTKTVNTDNDDATVDVDDDDNQDTTSSSNTTFVSDYSDDEIKQIESFQGKLDNIRKNLDLTDPDAEDTFYSKIDSIYNNSNDFMKQYLIDHGWYIETK